MGIISSFVLDYLHDNHKLVAQRRSYTRRFRYAYAQQNYNISKGAVSKWCNGQRIPRKTEMLQVVEVTKGEVMPNDFYI